MLRRHIYNDKEGVGGVATAAEKGIKLGVRAADAGAGGVKAEDALLCRDLLLSARG